MLLQPPEPITTAASAAPTSISAKRREEKEPQAATVDATDARELTALSASDLSPLQPFELEDAEEDTCRGATREELSRVAERLKDRGNILFKLGDTDAAAETFTRVLQTLDSTPVAGGRREQIGGGWCLSYF